MKEDKQRNSARRAKKKNKNFNIIKFKEWVPRVRNSLPGWCLLMACHSLLTVGDGGQRVKNSLLGTLCLRHSLARTTHNHYTKKKKKPHKIPASPTAQEHPVNSVACNKISVFSLFFFFVAYGARLR